MSQITKYKVVHQATGASEIYDLAQAVPGTYLPIAGLASAAGGVAFTTSGSSDDYQWVASGVIGRENTSTITIVARKSAGASFLIDPTITINSAEVVLSQGIFGIGIDQNSTAPIAAASLSFPLIAGTSVVSAIYYASTTQTVGDFWPDYLPQEQAPAASPAKSTRKVKKS